MYCPPGTTFHPRLRVRENIRLRANLHNKTCDWSYCQHIDNECYEPCRNCGEMIQEEIWFECGCRNPWHEC